MERALLRKIKAQKRNYSSISKVKKIVESNFIVRYLSGRDQFPVYSRPPYQNSTDPMKYICGELFFLHLSFSAHAHARTIRSDYSRRSRVT